MERRRTCIEALKQLARSDDTNRDEVVRMRVKDCIEPEASDLRKQLQGLSEDIDARGYCCRGKLELRQSVCAKHASLHGRGDGRCAEAESGLKKPYLACTRLGNPELPA